MSWLVFVFALEAGLVPYEQVALYDRPANFSETSGVVSMEAEVRLFDHLFIGGQIQTYFSRDTASSGPNFWPFRNGNFFDAGLYFGPLKAGYRRYCTHAIVKRDALPDEIRDGGYGEVYVRLEGQMGGK